MPDRILTCGKASEIANWVVGVFMGFLLIFIRYSPSPDGKTLPFVFVLIWVCLTLYFLIKAAWERKFMIVLSDEYLGINKLGYGYKVIPKQNITRAMKKTKNGPRGSLVLYIKLLYSEQDQQKQEMINLSLLKRGDASHLLGYVDPFFKRNKKRKTKQNK